jgi:hypothetical protein
MAYDVTISINVDVKDGPKVKATLKPMGITDANLKKVMFYNDQTCKSLKFETTAHRPTVNCVDPSGHISVYCKKIKLLQANEKLAFLAIKAVKYTFKNCPEGDVPGVGFALSCDKSVDKEKPQGPIPNEYDQGILDVNRVIWISSEYVSVNQCNLADVSDDYLYLIVRPQMFDCSKDPKAAFEITVTYGIRGQENSESDFKDCCATNAVQMGNQHANMLNSRQRTLV